MPKDALPKQLSPEQNFLDMMNRKKNLLLPGILVILILLSAGCIGTRSAENTTVITAGPTVVTTESPAPLPIGGTVTVQAQPSTTPPTPTPAPEPVATQTTNRYALPTVSSITINSASFYVAPLSYDHAGGITSGNIDISGTIDSTSGYPLWVDMRVDMYGANTMDPPKATAYDTVRMFPYGTSEFAFRIDNYVFNARPEYATIVDTYNITIDKVTIIPS